MTLITQNIPKKQTVSRDWFIRFKRKKRS